MKKAGLRLFFCAESAGIFLRGVYKSEQGVVAAMLIDTHLHTMEYSPDSFLPIAEAVARARQIGLDGLCVTDHDTLGAREVISQWRHKFGFPLFLGVEVLTTAGDFIVFGLDEAPKTRIAPHELISRVHRLGGVAIAAHPYRNNGRGAGDLIRVLPELDGIECFNGSTLHDANLKAFEAALETGVAALGAADAHLRERVGLFATDFHGTLKDESDLIAAVREGACSPAAWDGSCFVEASEWCREQILKKAV